MRYFRYDLQYRYQGIRYFRCIDTNCCDTLQYDIFIQGNVSGIPMLHSHSPHVNLLKKITLCTYENVHKKQ